VRRARAVATVVHGRGGGVAFDVFDPDRCNSVESAWGWTVPVRSHSAGAAPEGAKQLAGNVWAWVGDEPDEDGWRVIRGGSYLDTGWGVRSARPRGLPWLDEVLWQIVRYPNLYASIAATVNFIARQPRVFAEMLGKMMWWCGEDKIVYGGETPIWHPQWALEEFWNFRAPARHRRRAPISATD
jgi:hypothetical protein